jgi:hypothetical protein
LGACNGCPQEEVEAFGFVVFENGVFFHCLYCAGGLACFYFAAAEYH